MALNYITLVLDLADGTGTPLATGQALLNPSAQLTDATDDMIVTKAQLSAKLAGSYPQVRLLATDYALFDDYDGMMQCRAGAERHPAAPRSAARTDSGQTCSASTATTSLLISCTG